MWVAVLLYRFHVAQELLTAHCSAPAAAVGVADRVQVVTTNRMDRQTLLVPERQCSKFRQRGSRTQRPLPTVHLTTLARGMSDDARTGTVMRAVRNDRSTETRPVIDTFSG